MTIASVGRPERTEARGATDKDLPTRPTTSWCSVWEQMTHGPLEAGGARRNPCPLPQGWGLYCGQIKAEGNGGPQFWEPTPWGPKVLEAPGEPGTNPVTYEIDTCPHKHFQECPEENVDAWDTRRSRKYNRIQQVCLWETQESSFSPSSVPPMSKCYSAHSM